MEKSNKTDLNKLLYRKLAKLIPDLAEGRRMNVLINPDEVEAASNPLNAHVERQEKDHFDLFVRHDQMHPVISFRIYPDAERAVVHTIGYMELLAETDSTVNHALCTACLGALDEAGLG